MKIGNFPKLFNFSVNASQMAKKYNFASNESRKIKNIHLITVEPLDHIATVLYSKNSKKVLNKKF